MHQIPSFASPVRITVITSAALAVLAGACDDTDTNTTVTTEPTPPLVARAIEYAGGAEALNALTGYRITSTGERFEYAEGFTPDEEPHLLGMVQATTSIDFANQLMRTDWNRSIDFLGATFETSYGEIVSGQVGTATGCDSIFGFCTEAMTSQRVASSNKTMRLLNPHLLLRRLLDGATVASEGIDRTIDGVTYRSLSIKDEWRWIELGVNVETGEIAYAKTQEVDHALGDVEIMVRFSSWSEIGELRFPGALELSMADMKLYAESERTVELDPTFAEDFFAGTDELPAPVDTDYLWGLQHSQWFQRWASIGIPLDPGFEFVQEIEIVPGVYLLGGAPHNTLAVELEDSVVLVDAPYHERRSNAILAKVAQLFPNKPVSHVVITHFHDDHSAGVRTFAAAGATIVVSEHGADYFGRVLEAPHQLVPDALAMALAAEEPIMPTLETVNGTAAKTIGTGERTVQVVPVTTTHAKDMVMVYVPHAKVAFQTDMYSPNPGALEAPLLGDFAVWSVELRDAIVDSGLDVQIIAGGHGAFVTFQQMQDHLTSLGL